MENKFLDYEGLQIYHKKLVDELKDLKFNPQMMFDSVTDLCDRTNWSKKDDNYIFGLRSGLIVTVGRSIWQLVDPSLFRNIITRIDGKTPEEKAQGKKSTDLGWQIIGGVDFNVNDHILEIIK